MIPLKTQKEIALMQKGGRILAWVMAQVMKAARPGIKTKELDSLAEKLIIQKGAQPSFKMVNAYRWASCINLNDGLVHGIPGNRKIKAGDVIKIDLGVYYEGFHTDMARTFCLRTQDAGLADRQNLIEKEKFIETGYFALQKATAVAKPGNHVGHISKTIQKIIEAAGYSCSQKYTGHGVGRQLHEEPRIPCFLQEKMENTPLLKAGMVLAIEIIYTQGKPEVKINQDGWTAQTIDGRWGGLFENTVALTQTRTIALSMI